MSKKKKKRRGGTPRITGRMGRTPIAINHLGKGEKTLKEWPKTGERIATCSHGRDYKAGRVWHWFKLPEDEPMIGIATNDRNQGPLVVMWIKVCDDCEPSIRHEKVAALGAIIGGSYICDDEEAEALRLGLWKH